MATFLWLVTMDMVSMGTTVATAIIIHSRAIQLISVIIYHCIHRINLKLITLGLTEQF